MGGQFSGGTIFLCVCVCGGGGVGGNFPRGGGGAIFWWVSFLGGQFPGGNFPRDIFSRTVENNSMVKIRKTHCFFHP